MTSKLKWCPDIDSIEDAFPILEAKYRRLKHEQAYIEFENGKVGRAQGTQWGLQPDFNKLIENAHMLHNHPGHLEHDKGLSGPDIGYTVSHNLKSMTVFDNGLAVRITRPKKGWRKTINLMLRWTENKIEWDSWGDIDTWKIE